MESEGGGRCSLEIVFSSFMELIFADSLSWIVRNLNEVLLGQVEWNLARSQLCRFSENSEVRRYARHRSHALPFGKNDNLQAVRSKS